MEKYQNGKIYKLTSPHTEKIYIGSTCMSLENRMYAHKSAYVQVEKGNKKHKTSSYELFQLGINDVQIVLCEKYPCKSNRELKMKEQEYVRNYNCVNKRIPLRTAKEWQNDNKEKLKKYYEKNKDKLAKYNKQYREANKEKLSEKNREYRENNKEFIKHIQTVYRINHREELATKQREYNEKNKKEINERRSKSLECDCGSTYTLRHKSRHFKSQKHQYYIQTADKDLKMLI